MLSVAKVHRRNAWRYYVRWVAFGVGRRPARQPLEDALEKAGLPPGGARHPAPLPKRRGGRDPVHPHDDDGGLRGAGAGDRAPEGDAGPASRHGDSRGGVGPHRLVGHPPRADHRGPGRHHRHVRRQARAAARRAGPPRPHRPPLAATTATTTRRRPRRTPSTTRTGMPPYTPVQRAAAVQAHQQAAMPELLEGRTTDPETWMRTPEHLDRFAAFKRESDARPRAVADHLRQTGQPASGGVICAFAPSAARSGSRIGKLGTARPDSPPGPPRRERHVDLRASRPEPDRSDEGLPELRRPHGRRARARGLRLPGGLLRLGLLVEFVVRGQDVPEGPVSPEASEFCCSRWSSRPAASRPGLPFRWRARRRPSRPMATAAS